MKKYAYLKKNKYIKCMLLIIVVITCIKLYTNFLFENLNNETPREAVVEFIYVETHSLKSFFIEVEECKDIDKTDSSSLYYNIKYNGWWSIPNQMGGKIEIKKIGNHYYVVEYIGYC